MRRVVSLWWKIDASKAEKIVDVPRNHTLSIKSISSHFKSAVHQDPIINHMTLVIFSLSCCGVGIHYMVRLWWLGTMVEWVIE